jgi:hypothetical protein
MEKRDLVKPTNEPNWRGCLTILLVLFLLWVIGYIKRVSLRVRFYQEHRVTDLKPYSSTYLYGKRGEK